MICSQLNFSTGVFIVARLESTLVLCVCVLLLNTFGQSVSTRLVITIPSRLDFPDNTDGLRLPIKHTSFIAIAWRG